MSERPRIVTAWLIGVLALVALDMRWTLWGIADGDPVKLQTGLERQACESLVDVDSGSKRGSTVCGNRVGHPSITTQAVGRATASLSLPS